MRYSRLLSLPALLAAAPVAPDPVTILAGRYSSHFRNALVDGSEYWSDNVVEVVRVDARHSYVNFSLQFYNGHSCSLSGIARADGDALTYRESIDAVSPGEPPCRIVLRRQGGMLAWNDDGTCKAHCGARGSFLHDGLPWSSKRSIRYMARLTASTEYRATLTAWRSKPAPR